MVIRTRKAVRSRRRGEQLESELLDAAWAELVHAGYANLTMESVAARARTGIAVLYRRWANKEQLVSFWAICIGSIFVFSVLAYSTVYGKNVSDDVPA